jgi:regulator of sigma E protease
LYFYFGVSEALPVLEQVLPDSPAAAIGLKSGDRILAVDGKPIEAWEQLTGIIHASPDKQISIEWERNGEKYSALVTPRLDPQDKQGRIGIGPKIQMRQAGLGESFVRAVAHSWFITKEVTKFVGRLFTGKESVREGLAGPLQIMQLAGQSARQGWEYLLNFTALISLQLAILNILPIPVLDGGHLVFLALERILRRPLSVHTRLVVQQIGMALLLALMVFIIINDIQKVTR